MRQMALRRLKKPLVISRTVNAILRREGSSIKARGKVDVGKSDRSFLFRRAIKVIERVARLKERRPFFILILGTRQWKRTGITDLWRFFVCPSGQYVIDAREQA